MNAIRRAVSGFGRDADSTPVLHSFDNMYKVLDFSSFLLVWPLIKSHSAGDTHVLPEMWSNYWSLD